LTVLVTGGLGYVGSHAVKKLVERGEDVICLDNLIYGHKQAACGSRVVLGDIGDREVLRDVLDSRTIDTVMHFAAFAAVGESVEQPGRYYDNNLSRALVLLECAIDAGVKQFIFSSTAAVFGEPSYTPIDENHPKSPTNPYGASKLMLERVLADYQRAYGMRSISLRYFNAAGADPSGKIGEDHRPEHHLIPLVFAAAMGKRKDIKVFGTDWPTPDGTCVRDYVHVNDLAQAHLRALDALRNGKQTDCYNLGNGSGYSVREVINTVEQVSGLPVTCLQSERRAGDPAVLVASSGKISRELGWKPEFPELTRIVETAWNWHRNHPDGFDEE